MTIPPPKPAPPPPGAPLAGKTILCIDDEPSVLDALERATRRLGLTVLKTLTGVAALRLIQTGAARPDLIFLDLKLPGLDGFAFLHELRTALRSEVPVVLLTGDARNESILRGYGEGATYYLTKPFENSQVVNIVSYLLGDLSEEERSRLAAEL